MKSLVHGPAVGVPTLFRRPAAGTLLALLAITTAGTAIGWHLGPGTRPSPNLPTATETAASPRLAEMPSSTTRVRSVLDSSSVMSDTPLSFARSAPLRAGFHAMNEATVATADIPSEPSSAVVAATIGDLPSANSRVEGGKTIVARHVPKTAMRATSIVRPDAAAALDKVLGPAEPDLPRPVLAYADPVEGARSSQSLTGIAVDRSRTTAIYDITGHTVHMPDGSKLEAHSGLREMLDNPKHIHVRMRGATPPGLYSLRLREQAFHGVRAIRLTPVEGNMFGRDGILAHTYMLGPRGDSNGCVVFKNYDTFLQAFLKGNITHISVVAQHDDAAGRKIAQADTRTP